MPLFQLEIPRTATCHSIVKRCAPPPRYCHWPIISFHLDIISWRSGVLALNRTREDDAERMNT